MWLIVFSVHCNSLGGAKSVVLFSPRQDIDLEPISFCSILRALQLFGRGQINVREYRRGNQKWTIQRNWQQDDKKNQNKNTTQYVLDNTIRKQTQIT